MLVSKLEQAKRENKKSFVCGKYSCKYFNNSTNIKAGDKFGKLTIIKRIENKKVINKKGLITCSIPMFLCKCSCGRLTIAQGRYLKYGLSKSCGCLRNTTNNEELLKYYKEYKK